jgi:methionyl-tRNA formyltransferase
VFFGTPAWAVPSLEALLASDIEVVAVVTNPDRPAGRGMKLTPSPVKLAALDAGLDVIQDRARAPELAERMAAFQPDVATVVAYGSILPGSLLAIPPKGFVNLHFSLLPAYRGAAPVQRSIMNGDVTTGVSVMVLTEGMDEGPVLARSEMAIDPDDTSGSLGEKLAHAGAPLLASALRGHLEGRIEPEPQDDSRATYAPKVTTDDARIDWSAAGADIRNLIRALDPEPGAWTTLQGTRVKVWRVTPIAHDGDVGPGEIVSSAPGEGTLAVGTGDGVLSLDVVQPATKRRMSGAEFARGARLTAARFEV